MGKSLTELVFILDRSGSMSGLEGDTIGGFNAMLEKQKKEPGEAMVTTVLFDDQYELLHDRINLMGVMPMTDREYYARGTTSLLDAIGKTIQKIKGVQKNTSEEMRAEKVLFVIITDGFENASREYSFGQVKKLIEEQKKNNWEFLFLGANIDSEDTGRKMGISEDRVASYHADSQGVAMNYRVMEEVTVNFRKCSKIDKEWNKNIKQDFKQRNNKSH
jgi:uncharacterized protein YegL